MATNSQTPARGPASTRTPVAARITSLISLSRALLSRAHSASLFSHISLASSLGRHKAADSRLLATTHGRRGRKNQEGSTARGSRHLLWGRPSSRLLHTDFYRITITDSCTESVTTGDTLTPPPPYSLHKALVMTCTQAISTLR